MASYAKELEIAQLAVQRAAILTKRVFHEKAKGTVDKNDKSPVTIGDFGAQALIIAALRHHFPEDEIVAEEEAAQLRQDDKLKTQIWDLAQIAQRLGITRPRVRMDSQSKYGSIARGAGDIYLRLPVSASYQEKIWDHAAGDLIVREAGGHVTDIAGQRLDFSVGRTLAKNKGVVAAPAAVHAEVLKVVQEVLNQKTAA
ncbi:3',5'-bisphosphate nucleotidase [Verticillium alfalfae VaMs.102]|uniref:3'(2'),5'-bisphosphate nucleotidase n=1 Tax=Verticillium alfalfae (strain VaMs.102 / ATCC MYA-4576 / FGSC 10136) TaxID=526221 RepID=C9STF4_VERA1|nr:3',5'-bisphosphate nucleotidase [Verticillium alfalfae VaMs.102]EEY22069.1 3',5'-bisphosphate nucleotidase [Verticillium alfalfae VaMs.102]